jgi:hypothetical protein
VYNEPLLSHVISQYHLDLQPVDLQPAKLRIQPISH